MEGTSPIHLREGDIVVFSTWARHRLGKDFGENPDDFLPERWERISAGVPGFIPFNKGPRICPGRTVSFPNNDYSNILANDDAEHYATIVLTYIVARMFQTFSTVSNYNAESWKEKISITFENENGVLIGLS